MSPILKKSSTKLATYCFEVSFPFSSNIFKDDSNLQQFLHRSFLQRVQVTANFLQKSKKTFRTSYNLPGWV